jgi:hypothetical protein
MTQFVPTHRHFKGGLYRFLHLAKDAGHNNRDGTPRTVVVYCGADGQRWVREFDDFAGRFTKLE